MTYSLTGAFFIAPKYFVPTRAPRNTNRRTTPSLRNESPVVRSSDRTPCDVMHIRHKCSKTLSTPIYT